MDSSGNLISTFQLEVGTVRSMIHQISELKVMVQEQEDDLLHTRKQQEALGKDLKCARNDVRRKDNMVAMFEARSRADSHSLRLEREQQWEESQEWQHQRKEWREEQKDMLNMYEALHCMPSITN